MDHVAGGQAGECCGCGGAAKTAAVATAKDPVCGMTVDPATSKHRFEHGGTTFHFCCGGCRAKFEADPAKYLVAPGAPGAAGAPKPEPAVVPGATYVCPMDPEVRQEGPGSCPVCGMALEPETVSAEAGPNPELVDMSRRFWAGLVLTVPLFAGVMGAHLGLWAEPSPWLQLVLAAPVVLWAGRPFFQRGWASVVNRRLNMFTLVALGTGAAFGFSLVATAAPGLFPAGFRVGAMGGGVPVYYEAAAVITVLVLLGQVLELRARERTGGAIRALLQLAPPTARRLRDGQEDEEVPTDLVAVGDRLRLRPGEAVPVDGTVLEGQGAVNEAMVTGEAMPVRKAAGDRVLAGTVNGTGGLVLRADQVGAGTMLARIVAIVAAAQRSRAPVQRLADRVAGWFVPAVLGVAVLAFAAWAVWGPAPSLSYGLVAAVSVVIIACPCALGLATPMSIAVGVGRGAGLGVLVRSAEALERMEAVDTLVLDKTGTLTEGRPRVVRTEVAGFAEAEVLRWAAALERGSEHPLAAAIVVAGSGAGAGRGAVEGFQSVTGQGVTGRVDGRRIAVGNEALVGPGGGALAEAAASMRQEGMTAVFVGVDGAVAGVIGIADPVKAGAAEAVAGLRDAGLRIVMLTGDSAGTARAVAARLGITEVHAGVLPEDKQRVVAGLRAEGRVVAMAGDGVNDGPALAAADVGLAMGTGTEVAMQSAGITLVQGDLRGIARARGLSRAVMRNIRQNLLFAFAYNAVGIPLAAGVLYPVFGLVPSPMVAALAMSLSSVSVIGNALRLRAVRV